MTATPPDHAAEVPPGARRRENAALLAAARCPGAPPASAGSDALDWRYLLDAAERQGISALLRRWLEGTGAVAAPDWVRTELDAAYWGQHFRNWLLLDALQTLLARAATAAVPVMPLKGAALLHGYYPAPALRPMSDLDVLVLPEHAARMADLLHAGGYRPVTRPAANDAGQGGEFAFVAQRAEGTVLVECRTEPLDPVAGFPVGLDAALAGRLRAHAARMWRRGTVGEGTGTPVVRVAPEDLLLHIASHLATRHAGFRLIWLHDLCRVLTARTSGADRSVSASRSFAPATGFDWDYFWREAALLNLTVPVGAALESAHRWLGAPLPPGRDDTARARLRPVRALERRIVTRAVAGLDHTDMAIDPPRAWGEAAAAFCRLTGPLPRVRALIFLAVPSREYLAWWMAEQGSPAAGYRRMLLARWRRIGIDLLRAMRVPAAGLRGRAPRT